MPGRTGNYNLAIWQVYGAVVILHPYVQPESGFLDVMDRKSYIIFELYTNLMHPTNQVRTHITQESLVRNHWVIQNSSSVPTKM